MSHAASGGKKCFVYFWLTMSICNKRLKRISRCLEIHANRKFAEQRDASDIKGGEKSRKEEYKNYRIGPHRQCSLFMDYVNTNETPTEATERDGRTPDTGNELKRCCVTA